MATLRERFSRWLTPARYEQAGKDVELRSSIDGWLTDYLMPSTFQYNGHSYPINMQTTMGTNRAMEVVQSLESYSRVLQQSPPAFAAEMVRASVVSQMRFVFRNKRWVKDRKIFSTDALRLLEEPWPNGDTGDLVARMEWHAALGGAAFVCRRPGPRLQVLRPDWTALLYGSRTQPDNPGHALDTEFLGYVYINGGWGNPWGYKPELLLPDECVHWVPLPDPLNAGSGMSWITPAIRELQSDIMAGQHKINYWENGATPNVVVTGIPAANRVQFDEIVDMLEERHKGAANAFRTFYLTGISDAKVIGNNFSEIDFTGITASGETRVAMLSRVPGSLLGTHDGQAGSSLNAGNFSAARRTFADTWVYTTLAQIASALAPLIKVPSDSELWYDADDILLLREDAKDAAEISVVLSQAIRTLVDGGFEPETAVRTVAPQWVNTLKHTGNVSVQLQPPGIGVKNSNSVGQLLQPENDF